MESNLHLDNTELDPDSIYRKKYPLAFPHGAMHYICAHISSRIVSPGTLLLVSLCGVLLSGCMNMVPVPRNPYNTPRDTWQNPEQNGTYTRTNNEVLASLELEVDRWLGVPHKWGGTTIDGVDCSGLVQNVFRSAFAFGVPRTTAEQAQIGKRIPTSEILPGDLVFFTIDAKTRHVGIYLGNNEFFHASSSAGVTVSRIDSAYWREHFWMIRRVLSAPTPPQRTASSESDKKRTGW